jgi:hypothetical protein
MYHFVFGDLRDCIALRNAIAHARVTAPPKVDDFVGIAR